MNWNEIHKLLDIVHKLQGLPWLGNLRNMAMEELKQHSAEAEAAYNEVLAKQAEDRAKAEAEAAKRAEEAPKLELVEEAPRVPDEPAPDVPRRPV